MSSQVGTISGSLFQTNLANATSIAADANGVFIAGSGSAFNGFSAYLSSTQSNVTGDNTQYQIKCDSTLYNIGSNYNTTTGLFTAPSSGEYLFSYQCSFSFTSTGFTSALIILFDGTFSKVINLNKCNPINLANTSNEFNLTGTFHVNLNASETFGIVTQVNGSSKTVSVVGGAANNIATFFSGYKIG